MNNNVSKFLVLALIILLSIFFLNYIAVSLSAIFYPFDIEQSEVHTVPRIYFVLIEHPEYLYKDINAYPFYITNDYPPLFYGIAAFFSFLLGKIHLAGRFVSFISSLIIGVLIFKIVFKKTKNKPISIISSLFFFSSYIIFYWGPINRVDILGALFSLFGLYFMLDFKIRRNFYLSIIFFILAVYTKQIFIVAPFASFIYIFLRDRKKSLKFLIYFSFITITLFLILNLLTKGQFYLHTIVYNTNLNFGFNELILTFIITNFVILILSFEYFQNRKSELFGIYFLISFIFGIFQTLKVGGATNYFIEVIISISILMGFLSFENKKNYNLCSLLLLFLIIQLLIFSFSFNHLLISIIYPNKYFPIKNLQTDKKILSYIKNSDGNIFIENSMMMNVNKTPYEPWGIYDIPPNSNLVNITKFEEYFKNQNYSLVIINDNFMIFPNLYKYVTENYDFIEELRWFDMDYKEFNWKIYRLKS